MAPAPTGMPPIDAATPRSTRGNGPSQVRWEGCPLVDVSDKEAKYIPANATVVLKVELKGWPDIGEDVQECRLGARVPIDVIANLEFTRDDLHRRYGPGIYFVHAYVAGDGEKGTTLVTPIVGETHEIGALDFDDVKDSDPQEEEDDVGTQAWRVPPSALIANPEIKEEIARRKEVRRELGIGEERRSGGNDRGRGGRMGARGGRGNDRDRGRGGRGGRAWGPGSEDDDHGRGFDDEPEEPEEVYDPNWMHPEPPPGKKWYFCGAPLKWRMMDAGSAQAQAIAPVTPPAPTSFLSSIDPDIKALLLAVVGTYVKSKITESDAPKANPVLETLQVMGALNKPADPLELKRMEIEAESKRAAAALEAENARIERENNRVEAQRIAAEAQRAHEARLDADRREAARLEAIAADERARQRAKESTNELIALKQLGLDPNAKPQRTEEEIRNAIKAEMRAEQLQRELDAARGVGDIAAQIKRAEGVLKAAGIDVASDASKSMLMEFFNTKAGEVAVGTGLGIADRLVNLLMAPKGANGQPLPPTSQGPTQAQIEAFAAEQQEIGRRQALAEMQRQQAAWDAAQVQQVPGVPDPVQMPPAEAPPMPAWQAVEPPAPVEQAPAAAPPEAPEAPAEVPAEAAPVETPAEPTPAAPAPEQAPEAPPVDAAPAETPAAPEVPVEAAPPPVERHPVIDRPETEEAA